jgi:hypothetical protein
LEADLVAARQKLQNAPVAALMSDPQSATLSRLMLLSEAEIRDAIAFLIAAIVEIGSALGFTFMVLAGRGAAASSPPASPVPESQPTPPPKMQMPVSLPETPADTVARWTLARLDVLHGGLYAANVRTALYRNHRGHGRAQAEGERPGVLSGRRASRAPGADGAAQDDHRLLTEMMLLRFQASMNVC